MSIRKVFPRFHAFPDFMLFLGMWSISMWRCMICLTRYYLGVHIGVFDEWGEWSMWYVWGRWEICTGLWWGNLKETDHLEGIDVRIILKWILTNKVEDVDWINLIYDHDKWQVLVSIVMNMKLQKHMWNFLTSCGIVSFFKKGFATWT